MADFADQQVITLSTGQRRRAAIAVVAIRRPRLWLLDEPHAGLDQAGRDIVDGLIADAITAGATVVVASHELDRVRPLATHVATVAGGIVHSFEALSSGARGREIWAVAHKDLLIEARSKVVATQVLPFALVILILFGLALDADRSTLRSFTPGLFWVATLFAGILAIQRSVTVETSSSAFEAHRLSGAAGWKLFAGKALAVAIQRLRSRLCWRLASSCCTEQVSPILCLSSLLRLPRQSRSHRQVVSTVCWPLVWVYETQFCHVAFADPCASPGGSTRAFDDGLGTTAVDGWSWLRAPCLLRRYLFDRRRSCVCRCHRGCLMPLVTEANVEPSVTTTTATGTGSRSTQLLGATCLMGLVTLLLLAFVFTDPDERVDAGTQHRYRAIRRCPPSVCALPGCDRYLYRVHGDRCGLRHGSVEELTWWDNTASASAEVGVVFCGLTLVTGSIWGRPIWNTWWEWAMCG